MNTALPRRGVRLAIALSACLAAGAAMAADWPSHPITFVAPFSPGGGIDLAARLVAKSVSEQLHQSIIVENRPGAGGAIGAAHVAHSAPDGYTFLVGGNSVITNSLIHPKQPYKDEALTPVVLMTVTPSIIVTSAANPSNNLKEFLDDARKNHNGRITFSTAGNGSAPQFVAEMLREATGMNVEPITYKSGGEGVTAVVAGQVDATSEASVATLPLIKGGKLKGLAITGDKRMASAPNIPTTAEEGLPTLRIVHWAGLLAPTGTPDNILDRMNAAVNAALKTPDVQQALQRSSQDAGGGTRASFTKFTQDERARLGQIVKTGHMQTD
ncbi:Twin-arginine translocation pathway signal [Bordetella genomosp. 9]|uniref:Twin-arginine translocation pathway signal n=1 Tax=Bordetella genomosp. 9 TaxID=1416803 RepID=A0A261R479_9BORD|nr:tripartite tricarboxylate transporter substrate binding protein [Bordetella genomosp. 9]OZI19123.1 Twin-arginine translocation pathway signal [Bordetella genomosp. 9]